MYKVYVVILCVALIACSSAIDKPVNKPEPVTKTVSNDAESKAPAVTKAVTEVGAWYGSGAKWPDKQMCLVFCDNGRLFLGDSKCDRTERSDYEKYIRYTRTGNTVKTQHKDLSTFTFAVDGNTAELSFPRPEFQNLPMSRVAESSSLCKNTTATERTDEQDK